eukprot:4146510-Amphidinium_carterae.1
MFGIQPQLHHSDKVCDAKFLLRPEGLPEGTKALQTASGHVNIRLTTISSSSSRSNSSSSNSNNGAV